MRNNCKKPENKNFPSIPHLKIQLSIFSFLFHLHCQCSLKAESREHLFPARTHTHWCTITEHLMLEGTQKDPQILLPAPHRAACCWIMTGSIVRHSLNSGIPMSKQSFLRRIAALKKVAKFFPTQPFPQPEAKKKKNNRQFLRKTIFNKEFVFLRTWKSW